MKTDFHSQYEVLGLSPTDDWPTVQSSYRKLVHKWHPDRHRDSSVSEAQAEQRFIRFTRAFNVLRDFYRTNNRLPLQVASNGAHAAGTYPGAPTREAAPQLSDDDILSSSILKNTERSTIRAKKDSRTLRRHSYFTGPLILLAMLIVTAGLILKLDTKATAVSRQKAHDALLSQRPSKFLRSAQEIQRASGTGAFIEASPASSALGSQISGDTFTKK